MEAAAFRLKKPENVHQDKSVPACNPHTERVRGIRDRGRESRC